MRDIARRTYVFEKHIRLLTFFLPKENVPAEQEQNLTFVRNLASTIFNGGIIKGKYMLLCFVCLFSTFYVKRVPYIGTKSRIVCPCWETRAIRYARAHTHTKSPARAKDRIP